MRWMLLMSGVALSLLAFSTLRSGTWLAWADAGVGGIAALAGALLPERLASLRGRVAILLGVACIALWLAGLATTPPPWLPWFTLAFAVGLLVAGGGPVPTGHASEWRDSQDKNRWDIP